MMCIFQDQLKTPTTMLIQFCSDIHLERRITIPKLKAAAEYVCLLGDIGRVNSNVNQDKYATFLHQLSKDFKQVYLVQGNHELMDKYHTMYHTMYRKLGVVHLENRAVTVGSVRLAGSTLFTPTVDPVRHHHAVQFFTRCTLGCPLDPRDKLVFLSHYPPSFALCEPKYRGRRKLDRFYNELEPLMSSTGAPDYWLCGHTHSRVRVKVNNTVCVVDAQPRGDLRVSTISLE